MDQVLEFLAQNYVYVAGGSAVVIVVLLIIIMIGNKKVKKGNTIQQQSNFVNAPNTEGANVNIGIPEPVLEPVMPVMESSVSVPSSEPVQDSVVVEPVIADNVDDEKKDETLEIFDL